MQDLVCSLNTSHEPNSGTGCGMEHKWSSLHRHQLEVCNVLFAGIRLYNPFREVALEDPSLKCYFPACQPHCRVRAASTPIRRRTGVDHHLTILYAFTSVDGGIWSI